MNTYEALLKHPRPMGRPFMYRWITIQANDLAAAKSAAACEARLCGWKVSKIKAATKCATDSQRNDK